MRRSLVALALVCVMGLAACGGDDDEESASTTAAAPTATTVAGRGGRFCELLRSYNDRFNRTRNVRDPGELRDLLRDARSDANEAQAVAPLEIKADAEIVARVVDDYVEALEKVDFNVGRVPVEVAQRVGSAEFLGAAQRIQVYMGTYC